MKKTYFGLLALAACLTLSAEAQLTGDKVPRERTTPIREQVKQEIEEARFHLGPLRLNPTFRLTNAGYNDNIFGVADDQEKVSDYTATVGAGLRGIVPLGSKVFLRADAIPEYTWYSKHSELNRSGHELRGSLLGLFNRMSLEATASSIDTVARLSSEEELPTRQKRDGGLVNLEIDVLRRLALFAGAQTETSSYRRELADGSQDLTAQDLDRDDNAYRGGIRYKFRSWFDVSGQVEQTTSEFDLHPEARDFKTTAYLLGIHYDRPKFFVNLSAGQREGKPYNGSSVPEFSGASGSYFVSYQIRRSSIDFYGDRGLVYSLFLDNPYFVESRVGAALNLRTGRRLAWRVYGENGNNKYPNPVLAQDISIKRTDDVKEIGGGVAIRVFRTAWLNLLTSRTDYSSNIGQFDRSITRTTVGISFQGDM